MESNANVESNDAGNNILDRANTQILNNVSESDREMLMADEELLDEEGSVSASVSASVNPDEEMTIDNNGNEQPESFQGSDQGALGQAQGRRGSNASAGYRRTSSRQAPGKKEGFYQENTNETSIPQSGDQQMNVFGPSSGRRASISSTGEDRLANYKAAMEKIKSLESILNDNKSLFFKEKLKKLKNDVETMNNGTHPVLIEKQKQLELEKRNRIWVAGLWKKHQLECLKNIFSKEKQAVEDDYKAERDGLREKMATALHDKRKKLEEDADALGDFTMEGGSIGLTDQGVAGSSVSSSSRINTRKLRKRAANEQQQNDRTNSRKKQTLVRPSIIFEAKDNEVNEDLSTLRKQSMIGVSAIGISFSGSATGLSISSTGIRSSTRRNQMEETVDVHFENGILYIDDRPFRKNDLISVYNVAGNETFEATILSINSTDMWIQKNDAGKLKIYMSQVRTGKYALELV